jgi:hypothetical protein
MQNTLAAVALPDFQLLGHRDPQLRALDMSGTAGIADPYLPLFHYGRNDPLAAGVTEHLLHPVLALKHVYVFEWGPFAPEVLTGLGCVGSRVLAENQHFLLHGASHFCIT